MKKMTVAAGCIFAVAFMLCITWAQPAASQMRMGTMMSACNPCVTPPPCPPMKKIVIRKVCPSPCMRPCPSARPLVRVETEPVPVPPCPTMKPACPTMKPACPAPAPVCAPNPCMKYPCARGMMMGEMRTFRLY